jgi:hypothetical protein
MHVQEAHGTFHACAGGIPGGLVKFFRPIGCSDEQNSALRVGRITAFNLDQELGLQAAAGLVLTWTHEADCVLRHDLLLCIFTALIGLWAMQHRPLVHVPYTFSDRRQSCIREIRSPLDNSDANDLSISD